MPSFDDFMKKFLDAIRRKDAAFLKGVYSEWIESSGTVPRAQIDSFSASLPEALANLSGCAIARTEQRDDFSIAYLEKDGSENMLVFIRKGDSWRYFDARSGFSSFKKAYSVSYALDAGRISITFNRKWNPFIGDAEGTGFVTLINSALKIGQNEIALESVKPLKATIMISSGREMMETGTGDVLHWAGTVEGRIVLGFKAE